MLWDLGSSFGGWGNVEVLWRFGGIREKSRKFSEDFRQSGNSMGVGRFRKGFKDFSKSHEIQGRIRGFLQGLGDSDWDSNDFSKGPGIQGDIQGYIRLWKFREGSRTFVRVRLSQGGI